MTTDIGDAQFYVIEQDAAAGSVDANPEGFDEAFSKAERLDRSGHPVHVLYTPEATQTQLTRFAQAGIRTSLAPQG
ncbi:hypothetical protein LPJGGPFB_05180 [Ensifer adhaerens]|uniref:hypothetical protein n=1 Tax=Ensifer adhaerens TaxID=106592 RepID=UPI0015681478|nr:hypothetical protein [Ensifer adhaerens]NRP21921.1 hypothetical protein [Ensifer adhaerens]